MALRTVFIDLETRKLAQDLHPEKEEGWARLRQEGGITALTVLDSLDNWPYLYDDTCLMQAVAHIEAADLVVGFRSEGFDIPTLENHYGRKLRIKERVDIFELVQEALVTRGQRGRIGEYTLGAISERTIGEQKLEKGSHAPALAAKGEWARLFRYCMDDTRKTMKLFRHIQEEGGIVSINKTFLPVNLPKHLRRNQEM